MIEHSLAKLGLPHEGVLPSGLAIKEVGTCILATLIVWVVSMLATWALSLDTTEPGGASPDPPVRCWRLGELRPLRSATATKRRSRLLRFARMGTASDGTSQLLSPDPGPILFAWQELIVLRHQEALGFG
jgi:hypothetical protein